VWHPRLLLKRGKPGTIVTAQAHDTTTVTAARQARRADAGTVRLSERDIDGLLLCGEHFGAPYDLLALALRVAPDRLPAIVARWRRAGYAETGRLGRGPGWCWLTRAGMTATGLGFPATEPSLGRLAHIRAVLAARLWLQASPVWATGQPWWHSERRLRADQPATWPGPGLDLGLAWPANSNGPTLAVASSAGRGVRKLWGARLGQPSTASVGGAKRYGYWDSPEPANAVARRYAALS
jgi:hypothetical protein